MKKTALILRFNEVDPGGDFFTKGSIKFSNPVIKLKDFDYTKPIGITDVFEDDNGLYANFNNTDIGFYPAIGIKNIQREGNTVIKCELFAVSISNIPNIDSKIKPIK